MKCNLPIYRYFINKKYDFFVRIRIHLKKFYQIITHNIKKIYLHIFLKCKKRNRSEFRFLLYLKQYLSKLKCIINTSL